MENSKQDLCLIGFVIIVSQFVRAFLRIKLNVILFNRKIVNNYLENVVGLVHQ
jgi:hypothetical protein